MAFDDLAAATVAACFPRSLATDVRAVTSIMPASAPRILLEIEGPEGATKPSVIQVGGEPLNILGRTYSEQTDPSLRDSLSPTQLLIYSCVNVRHADGHVRQRYTEDLLPRSEPWVPSFVLQLLGEYVIEIAHLIHRRADVIPRQPYQVFAAENPAFMARTRQKIVSYNAEFLSVAPSYLVLRELGLWDHNEGAHLIERQRRSYRVISAPTESIRRPQ